MTASAGRRLSPEDLRILALEDETVAGHTCKVLVLSGAVDVDELRSLIAGRLPGSPTLSRRSAAEVPVRASSLAPHWRLVIRLRVRPSSAATNR